MVVILPVFSTGCLWVCYLRRSVLGSLPFSSVWPKETVSPWRVPGPLQPQLTSPVGSSCYFGKFAWLFSILILPSHFLGDGEAFSLVGIVRTLLYWQTWFHLYMQWIICDEKCQNYQTLKISFHLCIEITITFLSKVINTCCIKFVMLEPMYS